MIIRCITCGNREDPSSSAYVCSRCGDPLEIAIDLDAAKGQELERAWRRRPLSVWRYREALPVQGTSRVVSLEEGGTHLHRCDRLAEQLQLGTLYVKNEGENPTGSFKDRGMTVGVTRAVERGVKTVICASTGNTSASLSAYAAKAGIRCVVLIPAGKIAHGKLAQAIAYGAQIVQIDGNFDAAMDLVLQVCRAHHDIYLLNSINPFRIEGQKTAAFEIRDQLEGELPDRLVLPVGNAGNITAYYKGFKELMQLGLATSTPMMTGVQAVGASPIAKAISQGTDEIKPEGNPDTIATAIRIGSPVNWKRALKAIRESNGTATAVTDQEILEAQRLLARFEGIFVEPASAASIAGLAKLAKSGKVGRDERIVCVTTGHGLKDPDAVTGSFTRASVGASLDSIEEALNIGRELAGTLRDGGS